MVADGANVTVGKPFISDFLLKLKVLKQARSKKIIVFKSKQSQNTEENRDTDKTTQN